MVLSVSVVDPCDRMAAWYLWLAVTAQHHERGSIASLGKDQNSKFKVWFLLSAIAFTPS